MYSHKMAKKHVIIPISLFCQLCPTRDGTATITSHHVHYQNIVIQYTHQLT